MIDLKQVAVATGGTLVVAEDRDILTSEQEDWLNEAGFNDGWKHAEHGTEAMLWPEHESICIVVSKRKGTGDLCWFIKLFGKEGDIYGKHPVTVKPATAVRDLSRLRLEVEKLDIALMRASKLYR